MSSVLRPSSPSSDDENSASDDVETVLNSFQKKTSLSDRKAALSSNLTVQVPKSDDDSTHLFAIPPNAIEIDDSYQDGDSRQQPILVPLRTARVLPSQAKRKSKLSGSDACPASKLKTEQLFFHWLTLPDTDTAIRTLTDQYKSGLVRAIAVPNEASESLRSVPNASSSPGAFSKRPGTPKSSGGTSPNPFGFHTNSAPMSPVTRIIDSFSFSPLMSPRQVLSQHWSVTSPNEAQAVKWFDLSSPPRTQSSPAETRRSRSPSRSPKDLESDGRTRSRSMSLARTKSRRTNHRDTKQKGHDEIPRFYYPMGEGISEHEDMELEMIDEFFGAQAKPLGDSERHVSRADFPELLVEVVGIPSFYSSVLFDRIMGLENEPDDDVRAAVQKMPESVFRSFYKESCFGKSRPLRMFNAILGPATGTRNYLAAADFAPLLESLLSIHPGLSFLHATPEFQQRYAEAVVERILYRLSRHMNGKIYFAEFHRNDFLETLMEVDEEEDINRERQYFSYEHFYVLYCRFWELDTDHDLFLSREDLIRYGEHSLTYRIVDRIFDGVARPLDSGAKDYMSFTDFVWFCLSEEDKTNAKSIEYWFRCLDLDGDGIVTLADLAFFYEEQLHRMECLGHETVPFLDMLCQLLDMLKPNFSRPHIYLRDLKRSPLAGAFLNTLFNLSKFFAMESRRMRVDHLNELTDWDRFAAIEYLRLSRDDDEEMESDGDGEYISASELLYSSTDFSDEDEEIVLDSEQSAWMRIDPEDDQQNGTMTRE